jgi:rare lipoprotein A
MRSFGDKDMKRLLAAILAGFGLVAISPTATLASDETETWTYETPSRSGRSGRTRSYTVTETFDDDVRPQRRSTRSRTANRDTVTTTTTTRSSRATRTSRATTQRAARNTWRDTVVEYDDQPTQRRSRSRVVEVTPDIDDVRPQRRTTGPYDADRQRFARSLSGFGTETGIASYYWQPQRLAGGGWFEPDGISAAHKTLPLGTRVRVTRTDTGASVDVTINDRGPYIAGRIIDLSRGAARIIGMESRGVVPVKVSVLGR